MKKKERAEYSEGLTHEAMVRLRDTGLTPEGLQKLVESRELAEQVAIMIENTRTPKLRVALKKDWPTGFSLLPKGTMVEISSIWYLKHCNKYSVVFRTEDTKEQINNLSWEDIEAPKVCILVEGESLEDQLREVCDRTPQYTDDSKLCMVFIFCATHYTFIGIQKERPDIKYCPLCRQRL